MSGRTFEDGQRNGVKAAVTLLHALADEMNDPKARALLNSVAFAMGIKLARIMRTQRRTPDE